MPIKPIPDFVGILNTPVTILAIVAIYYVIAYNAIYKERTGLKPPDLVARSIEAGPFRACKCDGSNDR